MGRKKSISSKVTEYFFFDHDRSIRIWPNPVRGETHGAVLIVVSILILRSRSKQKCSVTLGDKNSGEKT